MPDWFAPLAVGFVSGLAVTLLRLRHERGVALRTRMLEAADDFVMAYTEALDAIGSAITSAAHVDAIADATGDWVEPLRAEYGRELTEARQRARDELSAVRRRRPRIELLFGRHTPVHRSAMLAHMALASLEFMLVAGPPESEERAREYWHDADQRLRDFSSRARDAILAPPWSLQPLLSRARTVRHELRQRIRALRSR